MTTITQLEKELKDFKSLVIHWMSQVDDKFTSFRQEQRQDLTDHINDSGAHKP